MSLKKWVLIFIGVFLLLPTSLRSTAANPGGLLDEVKEIRLANGMKFLLLARKGAPVFTAYLRVKVGGIDEETGQTGIAHLLEHMAFKGTPKIGTRDYQQEKVILDKIEGINSRLQQAPESEKKSLKKQFRQLQIEAGRLVIKEEFSHIYLRNGATSLNATTSADLTSYFVTLPSNKLELWAYLESSRLRGPVLREFYSERDVVREERRSRVEDSPFGKLYEEFIAIAFKKSPYGRPIIGYQEDVEKLTATQVADFYRRNYVPANMVGAIVGNIDIASTEKILKEYFGKLPAREPPPPPQVQEPEPTQEKIISVPFAASPNVMFGYLKPNMPHPDDYVFDVLEQLLCEGRTSRLYRQLVEKQALVQEISCSPSTPGSRMDNLFFVYAAIRKGHDANQVLKAFDGVLSNIQAKGISDGELAKAKKKLLSEWYFNLQSNEDLASALSYFEAVAGTWKYIQGHQEKIKSVSSKDIQRVVNQYLQPNRRRVAILKPIRS